MAVTRKPSDKRKKRLHARNWAVFLGLVAFAVLIYAVTIVKIRMGYGP